MTQAASNNQKYCFNCHKIIEGDNDNPHNNFCSWNCQDKYTKDKEKWDKLKQEKEDARVR